MSVLLALPSLWTHLQDTAPAASSQSFRESVHAWRQGTPDVPGAAETRPKGACKEHLQFHIQILHNLMVKQVQIPTIQ